jgi:hypothetical protein
MKYIMLDISKEDGLKKIPIIFPDDLVHLDVARALIPAVRHTFHDKTVKVSSAGIVLELEGHCFGESETLKVKSDPHDTLILNSYQFAHGIVK